MGLFTISASFTTSSMRSSISSKLIWQPEHPPSHTVASFFYSWLCFFIVDGWWLIGTLPVTLTNNLSSQLHRSFSISSLMIPGFFSSCPCTMALGHIAPVGQACKHLPQEVQVMDSPRGIEVGNDAYIMSPVHHIPVMCAFHFVAHTHTTGAHDAAVMIHHIPCMWGIHFTLRKQVRITDMIQSHFYSLNPAVRIFRWPTQTAHTWLRSAKIIRWWCAGNGGYVPYCTNDHIGSHFCGAGTQQFVHPLNFHQAQTARADVHYTFKWHMVSISISFSLHTSSIVLPGSTSSFLSLMMIGMVFMFGLFITLILRITQIGKSRVMVISW